MQPRWQIGRSAMRRLVIVSNRVPAVRAGAPLAGGLAIGLKDAIAERETLWFGWSGRETRGTPGDKPKIKRADRVTFATFDLSHAQYQGFYVGFSNTMLWPLFHGRVGLAIFDREELAMYRDVKHALCKHPRATSQTRRHRLGA